MDNEAGGAVLGTESGTGRCKAGREATTVVGQHMGEAKGSGCFSEESQGAALGPVVLDGQVDGARAPIDGDLE